MIITNLIYIAQFDTNDVFYSAVHSQNVHTNAICAHMNTKKKERRKEGR